MMKQYLLLADQITYRNNKLTIINVWDQFMGLNLPAKFNFDLVFICGPNWEVGEHDLTFKVKSDKEEIVELGSIKVKINNINSVYNALAQNLNFVIEKNTKNITFIIEKNGEEVFTRDYPVSYIIELTEKPETVVSQ